MNAMSARHNSHQKSSHMRPFEMTVCLACIIDMTAKLNATEPVSCYRGVKARCSANCYRNCNYCCEASVINIFCCFMSKMSISAFSVG